MASKLRRTPLFGYDGNLGIPIIPPNSSNGTSAAATAVSKATTTNGQGYKHSTSKIKMEVVTSQQHYVTAAAPVTTADNSSKQNGITAKMATSAAPPSAPAVPNKISSATAAATTPATGSHHNNHTPSTPNTQNSSNSSHHRQQQRPSSTTVSNSPGTPNRHVNFGGSGDAEEKKREKFLTAKYGAHQMALIRKRLRVEMWMYERLQELYGADDIEIDLDEVLDMEDESDRRTYISELLRIDGNHPCTKAERVNGFVGDLLEKVKTL